MQWSGIDEAKYTIPVIHQHQVHAYKPPDHAGVECDDGDACAQRRTGYSYWVAVYQCVWEFASWKNTANST